MEAQDRFPTMVLQDSLLPSISFSPTLTSEEWGTGRERCGEEDGLAPLLLLCCRVDLSWGWGEAYTSLSLDVDKAVLSMLENTTPVIIAQHD